MSSNVSIQLTLLKRKQNRKGEIPIYLRFTQNRKSQYYSTGLFVKEQQWNKRRQEVRKNHDSCKAYNTKLSDLLLKAENIKLELEKHGDPTPAQIKSLMDGGSRKDFFEFAKDYIKSLENMERYRLAKQTRVLISKLKSYHGSTLSFLEITPEFVNEFKLYLKNEWGNGQNTINKDFERFEMAMKSAVDKGIIQENPFLKIEKVPRVQSEKEKLPYEQIKGIENLELEPYSRIWHSRNYFLFSFYNAGIRFSDLCCLKWKNIKDGRLKYEMRKTGNFKDIKLLTPPARILDYYRSEDKGAEDYIFPILPPSCEINEETKLKKVSSKNVVVNYDLKKIGRLAGIETSISFHMSRHSFADYARTNGMGLYDISKALAHSSLKVTEGYLKSFDGESLDKSMEKLFE